MQFCVFLWLNIRDDGFERDGGRVKRYEIDKNEIDNIIGGFKMDEFIFEKLDVWYKARELVLKIYTFLEKFPNTEKYALCDQIRRASISIVSNIAEGSGRSSVKEKIHFIEIAYGSLMETFCQIILAVDLKYLSENNLTEVKPPFIEVAKMLSGWRTNLKSKL